MAGAHGFKFFRAGGVEQVQLRDGADLAHLADLDQKLWMALAMPIQGVEFDRRTAALIDTDHDGRIRPPEVLAAVSWAGRSFKSLDSLFEGGESVPLANIADADLLASARQTLASLKKPDATAITLADVASTEHVFAGTVLNGDGVIIPDSSSDPELRQAIEDILETGAPVTDRSGKPGIDQARIDAFFTDAAAYETWARRGELEAELAPAGAGTDAAVAAIAPVQAKVEDYFARCRLAGFDPASAVEVNGAARSLAASAGRDLHGTLPELRALPLSRIEAGQALPFDGTVNPAWADELAALRDRAVVPLLGARTALTETDWRELRARLALAEAWRAARPPGRVGELGLDRLRALRDGGFQARLTALVAQDKALEKEFAQLEGLERLVRFQRDLVRLLNNFVSFAEFYGRKGSAFQVGRLYLDARSCDLCIEVPDPGKHAALASLSAAYIAYCDVTRPGEAKRTIAAILTDGDSANLMVGRAGVFYDRQNRDWDAVVTRIVSNPISVREAFWLPYQKLVRLIDEQITKRAQAADSAAGASMGSVATSVANADSIKPAAPAAAEKAPVAKPIDLGAIALVGTALGGVSALLGGFLTSLLGLGMWMPLGVLGVVLLISGPSMLLAYLKLRQRNLGPLLDANGWAINTRARLNVPLGTALTRLAAPPRGALISGADPFAEKKRPWKLYAVIGAVVVLGYAWSIGKLDSYVPSPIRSTAVLPQAPEKPAPPAR